jgi:hypothetical protein
MVNLGLLRGREEEGARHGCCEKEGQSGLELCTKYAKPKSAKWQRGGHSTVAVGREKQNDLDWDELRFTAWHPARYGDNCVKCVGLLRGREGDTTQLLWEGRSKTVTNGISLDLLHGILPGLGISD